MSIFHTITSRLRGRRAPVSGTPANLDPGDLDLGDKLAHSAQLTERLAVLTPDDIPRRHREALMLRALANVYYFRANLFLPHPGPESAFPAVYPLLQQMKATGDRHEQADVLARIRTVLHTANPYDPALDAISVLATDLPPCRPQLQPPPGRTTPDRSPWPGHGAAPGASRDAALAQQFPRLRPAPTTPAAVPPVAVPPVAVPPVVRSPAARLSATSPTGRRR
jgi:hypothetical protein